MPHIISFDGWCQPISLLMVLNMAELLFYQNPVPLSKAKHKNLRFKKQDNYAFASQVNTVPISGPEFFPCSRNHPVMFVETSNGNFLPVALLALTLNGHQLGDRWEGVYVPTFVQRYPFALAESKGVVMLDELAPHFSYEEGDALFSEDGEPSVVLQEKMEYLNTLDQAHQLTLEYTKALKVKGLLRRSKNVVQLLDREVKLENFYVVTERDLYDSLTDEEIVDWYYKGWIAWTYAHIHSIDSINEILKRMAKIAR